MIGTGSVVEVAGSPGAGKTTVVPLVVESLRRSGLKPRGTVDVARDLAARGFLGSLTGAVPSVLRRRLLWGVYLIEAAVVGSWTVLRRPGLARVLRAQRRRPAAAMVSERRVIRWFIRHAGTEALFRRRARHGEVLVVDEGYLHRTVQLFTSSVERGVAVDLTSYLASIPPPTLAVVVDAPAAICVDRVRERGVWDIFAHCSEAEVAAFVENAATTVSEATRIFQDLGNRLVVVPNAGSPPPDFECVRRALADVPTSASTPFRPRWAPPRLGTVRYGLGRLVGPRYVASADVARILGAAGLRQTGPVRRFSTGRRSAIVGVDTDAGRVVVKRYPEHWAEASIRHEHAVLAHLATLQFPAVRLVVTPHGESVVFDGDAAHALFRHVDGRTYAGRHMTGRMREDLFTDLGRLLARLHGALEGFDPVHEHHLGLDPASGRPRRGLAAYLELLATVDAGRIDTGDRVESGRWLEERSSAIEDRLKALDARIGQRELSTTVIHGDFGAHNVIFTPNGPVLHDFELARTEWRLTEIAMVLTRLRDRMARRWFLEAYRRDTDLGDEWAALDDVVQWYLLTGALYAWEGYLARADGSRLDVARDRVEQALALGSQGAETWM
jgi:Ser/Thr protein kinase RdoA (MazF antagonist)